MLKKITLSVKTDFEKDTIQISDKDNVFIFDEEQNIPKNIIDECVRHLSYKLSQNTLLDIKNDEITNVHTDDYIFFVDILNKKFYINISLSAKQSAILTERLIMLYPDFVFHDIIYLGWDKLYVGNEAERQYNNIIATERIFEKDGFNLIDT